MKIISVTGKGTDGTLQPFHIVNLTNLVINLGVVQQPGKLSDSQGNLIPVNIPKTIIHIDGTPLFVEETVDEILEKLN